MKRLKKVLCVVFSSLLILGNSFMAFADENIKLYVDGRLVVTDLPPQIINDRVYVAVRSIFEAVGATVTWDPDSESVSGKADDKRVSMSIDSTKCIIVNSNETFTVTDMGVTPIIIDGRVYAPARYVAESFNYKVDWDPNEKAVRISIISDYDKAKGKYDNLMEKFDDYFNPVGLRYLRETDLTKDPQKGSYYPVSLYFYDENGSPIPCKGKAEFEIYNEYGEKVYSSIFEFTSSNFDISSSNIIFNIMKNDISYGKSSSGHILGKISFDDGGYMQFESKVTGLPYVEVNLNNPNNVLSSK